MKRLIRLTIAPALAMTLGFAPPPAEAGHGPCCDPPPFAEFDADGDGFLSEAELEKGRAARHAAMAAEGGMPKGMATAPGFADMDADGDGRLSEAEFAAAHQAHRQQMHAGGHGRHHAGKAHMSFESIDTDGDGCISRQEFDAHHAR